MPEICSYCFRRLTPKEAGKGNCPECHARLRGALKDKWGVIRA